MSGKIKNVTTPTVGTPRTAEDTNMSVGAISSKKETGPKTSGIKMRGAGAATKGTTCRGPMA